MDFTLHAMGGVLGKLTCRARMDLGWQPCNKMYTIGLIGHRGTPQTCNKLAFVSCAQPCSPRELMSCHSHPVMSHTVPSGPLLKSTMKHAAALWHSEAHYLGKQSDPDFEKEVLSSPEVPWNPIEHRRCWNGGLLFVGGCYINASVRLGRRGLHGSRTWFGRQEHERTPVV